MWNQISLTGIIIQGRNLEPGSYVDMKDEVKNTRIKFSTTAKGRSLEQIIKFHSTEGIKLNLDLVSLNGR